MLAYTIAAWFSIVYLGDHYVVDILGGIVYVAVVYRLLPLFFRRASRDDPVETGTGVIPPATGGGAPAAAIRPSPEAMTQP
jgi:membrane-associated phospholipid phosphatase